MSRPTSANYGPGSGGGTYRAYGAPGTYQNQPGLRELGDPRSQNIWNEPGSMNKRSILDAWAQLQQQYPQYTNHAQLLFGSNNTMTMPNGYQPPAYGVPSKGQVVVNQDAIGQMSPEYVRYVLAKELGQAIAPRTLTTKDSGNQYMNAIGYRGNRSSLGPENLALSGSGPWGQAHSANAMNYGSYRTYPEDIYGLDFARALGRMEPGITSQGMMPQSALLQLQAQGMLPRQYAPPTVPQRPAVNVNDFGRRGVQQPVPTAPAVLPAQVNSPRINAYARVGGVRYS